MTPPDARRGPAPSICSGGPGFPGASAATNVVVLDLPGVGCLRLDPEHAVVVDAVAGQRGVAAGRDQCTTLLVPHDVVVLEETAASTPDRHSLVSVPAEGVSPQPRIAVVHHVDARVLVLGDLVVLKPTETALVDPHAVLPIVMDSVAHHIRIAGL